MLLLLDTCYTEGWNENFSLMIFLIWGMTGELLPVLLSMFWLYSTITGCILKTMYHCTLRVQTRFWNKRLNEKTHRGWSWSKFGFGKVCCFHKLTKSTNLRSFKYLLFLILEIAQCVDVSPAVNTTRKARPICKSTEHWDESSNRIDPVVCYQTLHTPGSKWRQDQESGRKAQWSTWTAIPLILELLWSRYHFFKLLLGSKS